jgi:hypothetical protein
VKEGTCVDCGAKADTVVEGFVKQFYLANEKGMWKEGLSPLLSKVSVQWF